MRERIRGEAYRSTQVCVDSYEKGVMTGRFYNLSQADEGCVFHSLAQFLVGMENMLDSNQLPQSFTAKRTFAAPPEPRLENPPDTPRRKGQLATFQIRILFRQHTSWQGSIHWLEGGGEQTFRSVLELILLMDSALGGCQEEQ